MTRYTDLEPGEDGWTPWILPVQSGYKLACCDCGLVHDIDFRFEAGMVEFKVKRNNRATGAMRRSKRREP